MVRHHDVRIYCIQPERALDILNGILMKAVKNYSAREANRLLSMSGPSWQAESYDHWARDGTERSRIRAYIHENPVKVGLAAVAEEYRWSSAWRDARD